MPCGSRIVLLRFRSAIGAGNSNLARA